MTPLRYKIDTYLGDKVPKWVHDLHTVWALRLPHYIILMQHFIVDNAFGDESV